MSSAIAGTRKIIIGLSRSTTSNQWSTSNFGMYSPVSPIFIGLKMKLMPANVNSGAPCSQPRLGPVRRAVRDHRDVAVADEHALRQAGRARRVHDVGDVVGVDRHLHRRSRRSRRARVPVDVVAQHRASMRHRRRSTRARALLEQPLVRDDDRRLGVAQDRQHLVDRQARVRPAPRPRPPCGSPRRRRSTAGSGRCPCRARRGPACATPWSTSQRATWFDCSSHSRNVIVVAGVEVGVARRVGAASAP